MIISCEKCNKKFDLEDSLMPNSGRLLQCGSCSYQWHFTPKNIKPNIDEVTLGPIDNVSNDVVEKEINKEINIKIKKTKSNTNEDSENNYSKKINKKKKKVGFLNYLIVIIISIIAIIILLDTFKIQISLIFPDINLYLNSLYEIIKDISLFIQDLI